ncbi:CopG family transcriptional regulator [Prodigiosinella confusarubida]|uniref:CopG family transcriptional regulator n=2 Tax=Serratia sp. (strain ATCC 39006) TaxID=104623 RepID=A0A2I5T1C7_SERS3|nr:CopG family transcriptional regulator [Serratia sp. ATCC 39006]AUH02668.1 CopG family transcriptional regulator [Serratia sp. ATCC 39006]
MRDLAMKKTKKSTVALTSLIEKAEQRHQRVLQGLADVDAGRVVNPADMQAFIVRLKQA